MCGGRGAHDWLGEEGSTSGGGSKSALFVHICALFVHICALFVHICALIVCVYLPEECE